MIVKIFKTTRNDVGYWIKSENQWKYYSSFGVELDCTFSSDTAILTILFLNLCECITQEQYVEETFNCLISNDS